MPLFSRSKPIEWLRGKLASDAAIERPRQEPVLAPLPQRRAVSFRAGDTLPRAQAKPDIQQAFTPYQPPPGVLPAGQSVAMDEMPVQQMGGWLGNTTIEGNAFVGYPILAQMALQPEYRHFIEVRAKEVTREWIEIQAAGDKSKGDKVKRIEDRFEQLNVRTIMRQMSEMDGAYGRGQIFANTGYELGDARLTLPLLDTPETWRKGSLKSLVAIEPFWTYPTNYNTINPMAPDFYKPNAWFVQGNIVHASRLLTCVSRPVADILKPTYNFGGVSLVQMLRPYVDNWMRTRDAVSDLIESFSIIHFATDMAALMQAEIPNSLGMVAGAQGVLDRVAAFNAYRNNRGTFVTDKLTEDLKNLAVPLSGLDKLQAQALEQCAAFASTPLIKAFGITPSGLNASSDGELRAWYDFCESYREHLMRGHLHRILKWVQLDEFGEIDPGITLDFIPLWQMDETARTLITKTLGDIDAQNIAANIITPEEARERLAKDAAGPYAALDLSKPLPEPEELDDSGGLGDDPAAHLLPDPAAALPGASAE